MQLCGSKGHSPRVAPWKRVLVCLDRILFQQVQKRKTQVSRPLTPATPVLNHSTSNPIVARTSKPVFTSWRGTAWTSAAAPGRTEPGTMPRCTGVPCGVKGIFMPDGSNGSSSRSSRRSRSGSWRTGSRSEQKQLQ